MYVDFTPNMTGRQPFGNVQPNFEYIDVADYKAKFNIKNKGVKNYVTRVPALNQTDYFGDRQPNDGGFLANQKNKYNKKRKEMPGTAALTQIEDDPNFLIFEQTSDNGQGMKIHKSKQSQSQFSITHTSNRPTPMQIHTKQMQQ